VQGQFRSSIFISQFTKSISSHHIFQMMNQHLKNHKHHKIQQKSKNSKKIEKIKILSTHRSRGHIPINIRQSTSGANFSKIL
jgi:hypothetical protein